MAQYQSSLTGPEIDAALTDVAQHNSEAWAVGTRDGVAVTSLDITYHNNAKYYSDNAVGAAARAEAAVPAGTSGAVFFDQAQTLTDAQKEQARSNIGADSLTALRYFQVASLAAVGGAAKYRIFARTRKNSGTTDYASTFAVAGVASWTSAQHGVYIIQTNVRSGSFAANIKAIAPCISTPTFGYYDGGDGYYYIGVYAGTYCPAMTAFLIAASEGFSYPAGVSSYGVLDSAPAGWTTLTIS